jgi:outer membrane cobalamin receptor
MISRAVPGRTLCSGWLAVLITVVGTSAQNSSASDNGSHFQPLRAAARAPAATRTLVSVAFDGVRLESALQEIASQAGLGISYRPELPGLDRRVVLRATHTSAAEALLRILEGSGLELLVAEHGRTLLLQQQTRPPARVAPGCALRGVIRAADSGGPLAAAEVRISGAAARTLTGADGSFCLARVPPGTYTVEAGLLGYATARLAGVTVPGDAAQQLTITLTPAAISLTDIVVTPGHFGIAHEAINKPETLNREQIETLPQLAEDIYRTVNRLPGITSNEMTARFYVRGGDDRSVLVLLDGLELFEPYHLKDFDGSLSILDVAAIGGVDLTTGGFSAEYGNRLTGVFDLRTTNQLYTRPRTAFGLSLSNARVMSQGSFAHGHGMWLFSARRGYLDILLKLIDEDTGVDPRYYDVLGKVVYQFSPGQRVSARVLRAGDTGELVDDDGVGTISSNYGSTYAWMTWQADWSDRLQTVTQLSAGGLDWNRVAQEHDPDNDYDVRDARSLSFAGLKQDWLASISPDIALKWGFETRRSTADYDYFKRIGRERIESGQVVGYIDSSAVVAAPRGTDVGLYIAPRVRPWAPLTLEAGLRWDRQSHTREDQLSPRLNLALALGAQTTLRAAWGRYAQPHPLYELQVKDNESTFGPAERAEQWVAGIERSFGRGITTRLEAYRRDESDLRTRYRNLLTGIEPVAEVEDDRVGFDPETGRAQGIELFVQQRGARSNWSASYALARAYEVVEHDELDRPLDQRHTFYIDYAYAPSPAWRLSWSWQYHTGWPITRATFRADSLNNGDIYFTREYGSYYADRLPAYHRMDLRVTRNFALKRGRLSMFFDVFNLYNRSNAQAYNYSISYRRPNTLTVSRGIESLLPRLPTLGVTWEF